MKISCEKFRMKSSGRQYWPLFGSIAGCGVMYEGTDNPAEAIGVPCLANTIDNKAVNIVRFDRRIR